MKPTVLWEELLPREFHERLAEEPTAYLPMGLCEPHGHAAAFGLDTIKAEWLCKESARRHGGIVAPTQTWQIHETGYHRPWLAEVIDEGVNPRLGSVPPDVLLRMLLFQLRALVNAGFRRVLVVTGHNANQHDLRLVAEELRRDRPVQLIVVSDPELATPRFPGDHAGRYELSQLMHIRPDLVDLGRVDERVTSPLGRFAQGEDAARASAEYGRDILEASLLELALRAEALGPHVDEITPLTLEETEVIWARVVARTDEWCTLSEDELPLGE